MKQYSKQITLVLLALLGASCTNDQEPAQRPVSNGTPLRISTGTRAETAGDYEPFAAGEKIRVYYAHSDLNTTYEYLQGVYQFPANGNINTNWTPIEWTPEGSEEETKGIYLENIQKANGDNGKFIFTATSYPEPHVSGKDYNTYMVNNDQSKESDHKSSDFLAARAVYSSTDNWKENGVTLHFRHVLSKLIVKLILPKGSTADGFFPDPANIKNMKATINGKYNQYTVTYASTTKTGEIFDAGADGALTNIEMYKDPAVTAVKTPEGREAACHTFSAILPKQSVTDKLLSFVIDGKNYSYSTPDQNTVTLGQEQITTIQLTVLSGAGNQKLVLNEVTMEDWKTDKADVGDLIPESNQ